MRFIIFDVLFNGPIPGGNTRIPVVVFLNEILALVILKKKLEMWPE